MSPLFCLVHASDPTAAVLLLGRPVLDASSAAVLYEACHLTGWDLGELRLRGFSAVPATVLPS